MTLTYPPRLKLAQTPTPLLPLSRLSAEIGGPRIWVKRDDMTGSGVSGNKIRKLEFSLAKALEDGCDTVITCGGVQSNHCRTTALLCAQLGLRCHLVLRGSEHSEIDGNLLLDRLVGADISFYSNAEFQQRGDKIYQHWLDHYASLGSKAMVIPVGASDGIGLWGYIAACEELKADFAREQIQPRHIISATGSGGTQGGLTVGNALYQLGATVWGINVCDDEQYFLDKVAEDIRQWQQWYPAHIDTAFNSEELAINVIDGYVGAGYAQASEEVFEMIKHVATLEGLILDPVYTGKAFYGMLDQIKLGLFDDSEDIVFIHTGGIFGLFPQRGQLKFNQQ
ncbi:D-cysteine desulfhydrase family protein [Oceanicoccus sagamiensis]|uniref:D-cysteine desulfhydrase n=1 Tax=Oceanicoccus sagamiensis TaxID=716816 RepID=A0A1X9NI72_9GAMM|nr:D-cysteine desulfhydrase family protein [Oceanicoccus sagamiensis]ARN76092.1 D-cysteine desulfhydrase [Oceanicoccus sagamiensis]